MHASTQQYLELQRVYRARADAGAAWQQRDRSRRRKRDVRLDCMLRGCGEGSTGGHVLLSLFAGLEPYSPASLVLIIVQNNLPLFPLCRCGSSGGARSLPPGGSGARS